MQDDVSLSASTYLYVFDEDHLLANRAFDNFMHIYENDETIIPCRPTNPDVNMKFFKDGLDITEKLAENRMKYEPQKGLIVPDGDAKLHQMHNILCKASYGTKNQVYKFRITFVNEHIYMPYIMPRKYEKPAIAGQKFVLQCNALFYGIPPKVILEWEFPSEETFIVHNQTREKSGMEQWKISRTLTIPSLSKSYENSKLFCYMRNKDKSKQSEKAQFEIGHIRSHDKEGHIGEVKFQGDPEIKVKSSHIGKKIQWIFNVFAAPDPEYFWHNPKGELIDHEKYRGYKLDIYEEDHRISLSIDSAKISDIGKYSFDIYVKNENLEEILDKSIDMYLKIETNPQVVVGPKVKNSFFLAYKSTLFTCQVQGFPIDESSLQWTFKACNDFSTCQTAEEHIAQEFYTQLEPIDGNLDDCCHYNFSSNLTQTLDKSGIYTCQVCSESDPNICDKQSISVFLNDFSHDGFSIDTENDLKNIIEGDQVEISCAGSSYLYKSVYWEGENLNIINKETEFSYVSVLKWSKIKINDGGHFQCMAVMINGTSTQSLNVTFDVLEAIQPLKGENFNMKNEKLTLQKGDSASLDCSIEGGRPEAAIYWFKDDEPYIFQENTSHIEVSDDLFVITFRYTYLEDSGVYECVASNRAGNTTGKLTLEIQDPIELPPFVIALIVSGCVIVLILGIILAWRVKVYQEKYKMLTAQELRMFENGDPNSINPELAVDDQADLLPYNKSFEFARESLKTGKQLGSGAFGRVVKAQAIGITPWERSTIVAVKMVKPNADIMYVKALMSELKIMIHLGKHLNIVNLLGACTKGLARKELLVIVEYCRFGNLQKYLLQHRYHYINQTDPESGEIDFSIGQDIIDGYGGGDLAKLREDEEMSALYLRHQPSTNGESIVIENPQSRPQSVRYVVNPKRRSKKRTISMQSDYSVGGQIMTTDMTTLPEEDEEQPMVNNRTQSMSSQKGPGWRANMKGDYDAASVKPISTKDLICWAYQVNTFNILPQNYVLFSLSKLS